MTRYSSIYGTIRSITPMPSSSDSSHCILLISVMTENMEPYNLVVPPYAYVLYHQTFTPGDSIIAFYETLAPVPLIYPPQLQAGILAGNPHDGFGIFDFFDENLINSDQTLKLNLTDDANTNLVLSNGQTFTGNPGNHYLLVLYTTTTKSIPAITTPQKVVVFCMPDEDS